jgi:DNA-binding winged helix-turn-helix (wHTH) protein
MVKSNKSVSELVGNGKFMQSIWFLKTDSPFDSWVSEYLLDHFSVRRFPKTSLALEAVNCDRLKPPSALIAIVHGDYDSANLQPIVEGCSSKAIPLLLVCIKPSCDCQRHNLPGQQDPIHLQMVENLRGIAEVSVAALLRLSGKNVVSVVRDEALQFRNIRLKPGSRALLIDQGDKISEISISHTESEIIKFLMRSQGTPVSRQEICHAVWGRQIIGQRTLDAHISRLRKRIEGGDAAIAAVYGKGYALQEKEL